MTDQKAITGTISVKSSLVFANFFACDDCEKEDEWTAPWSLNCLRGWLNITQFKATKQNIAYGQMGNMSVGIFVNDKGNSIIVGDYWNNDEIDEHRFVGKIDCEVWRWEAGDKEVLGDLYGKAVERHGKEHVIDVPCETGLWKFEHYYGVAKDLEDKRIYARLWRVDPTGA